MPTDRDIELSPTLNLLAALIGSFANPNPDDEEWHGPGGPRVRGELEAIRRVTIAVAQWAETLGEQNMANMTEKEFVATLGEDAGKPRSRGAQLADVETADDCDASDPDCDPTTQGMHKKQPPISTMAVIRPAVSSFVHDLLNGRALRLPVAVSREANPWKLSQHANSAQAQHLLIAGAQFQFAAEATRFENLAGLFQQAARRLIGQGLAKLGHDARLLAAI